MHIYDTPVHLDQIFKNDASKAGVGNDKFAYSISETAQMLGVSYGLMRDIVARGDIKGLRFGKRLRFTREQIAAYLNRAA